MMSGNALLSPEPIDSTRINPLAPQPTWADAAQNVAANVGGWIADQRAQSEQQGLWGPGGITPAGARQAGMQTAGALAMATTAPGDNPAFANWFGKSKIVDDAGNPQVMYHGSNADVHAFDLSKSGQARGHADESAIFLTSDPKLAGGYADIVGSDAGAANAGVVYPVHVQAENPYQSGLDYYNSAAFAREIAKAKQQGHDSIQFPKLTYEGEHGQMAVFSPTQLKSAIGNRGTYSPTDPRLTYGAAGLAAGAAAAGTQGGS